MVLVPVLTRDELANVVRDILGVDKDSDLPDDALLPVYRALSRVGIGFLGCEDLQEISQV